MLYGNLTSDPEVRAAKSGGSFTTFAIATNSDWKNKEGAVVSETNYHKIVAFGKLGEIVGTYLKKGRPVLVCGRLNNRSYETKEGSKRYVTEVVLDDFNFLPSGRKAAAKKSSAEVQTELDEMEEAVAA